MRGFFDHLAHTPRQGGFTGIQMACRVVQAQALRGVFLDQEEAAVAFDDGGNRHAGFPSFAHKGQLSVKDLQG